MGPIYMNDSALQVMWTPKPSLYLQSTLCLRVSIDCFSFMQTDTGLLVPCMVAIRNCSWFVDSKLLPLDVLVSNATVAGNNIKHIHSLYGLGC